MQVRAFERYIPLNQFHCLTELKRFQEGTYQYKAKFLHQDRYQCFMVKYLISSGDHFITPWKDVIITSLWQVFDLPGLTPWKSHN